MDRAEASGLGIAMAGHVALFAALSAGLAASKIEPPRRQPIEVSFVEEAAIASTSPTPSLVEPAALLAPEPGPPQPAVAQSAPAPVPQPSPAPALKPLQRTVAAKPAPSLTQPRTLPGAKPTGRLNGLVNGLTDRETVSRSADPPAATLGPAVKASLAAEVRRQLKPHWKAPTGADAELLRTRLSIWLAPNGSVTKVEVIDTTGQTASNRPQVKLHQEQAIRAVRLAAPFQLPAQYYEAWKFLSPIGFDRKLAQ